MLRRALWQKACRAALALWFALLFAAGVPAVVLMSVDHAEVKK